MTIPQAPSEFNIQVRTSVDGTSGRDTGIGLDILAVSGH
jgi:hypothetical protein